MAALELTTVKEESDETPPTLPLKLTAPVPAVIERAFAPFNVEEKETSPAPPAPVVNVVVPPPVSVAAPIKDILAFDVVKVALGIEIAVDVTEIAPAVVTAFENVVLAPSLTVSDVNGVVPPMIPLKVVVPVPTVIARALAPLSVDEKETLPAPPAPVVSVVVPPPVSGAAPIKDILASDVVKVAVGIEIAVDVISITPVVVTFAFTVVDDALRTLRRASGVDPPTIPLKLTAPVPAVIKREFAPFTVDEKETSPAPLPVSSAVVPPPVNDTAPVREILLSVVVNVTLAMEIALDVIAITPEVVTFPVNVQEALLTTVKAERLFVAPMAPLKLTAPVPAVIERALVAAADPLIVEEKVTSPAPAPVVIVVVPAVERVTGPVIATSPSAVVSVMSARETPVPPEIAISPAALVAEVPVPKTTLLTLALTVIVPVLEEVKLAGLDKVMSPLPEFVFPAPFNSWIERDPVPTSIAELIAMAALPASRSASTTPLAKRSLPMIVKLPLSVVIFAEIVTLRPALKVRFPPFPPGLFVVIAELTVRSLFACKTTAVPAFNVWVKNSGITAMS